MLIERKIILPAENFVGVVSIDSPDTRKREDGFFVDHEDNISIVSLIPNLNNCNFVKLEEALLKKPYKKETTGEVYYFDQGGLSKKYISSVFLVRMKKPYNVGSIEVGTAMLTNTYFYSSINKGDWHNHQIESIKKYATNLSDGKNLTSEEITNLLSDVLNNACEDTFLKNKIPFMGRHHKDFLVCEGLCAVTGPLRKAPSAINSLQLAKFLSEGKILFSEDELYKLIGKQQAV